ncbi:MAG: 3'(2'),5'-bisphosphate nucleotidase CysQ [Candidatus Nanopelagicales bacterium]|nr:3'(2'),5'-bisphosphate nucleotidase CysQ [Candidatus Nanopelagicales bacterium]
MTDPTTPGAGEPDQTPPAGPVTDAALATAIARAVGRALLELRDGFGPVDDGNRRTLMDAGDARAQAMIADRLNAARPGDAVLSEEAVDTDARLGADRVWIIDPLDGTSEYGEGRTDFAVHVALWRRDAGVDGLGAVTDAAVDVPGLGETWRTDRPEPTAALPSDRPLRVVVSRSRPPAGLDALLALVSADLVAAGITPHGIERANVGSVGAKLGEVMAGRAEAYLHPGGLNEWDLAAPHACALAHGYVALGPVQPFNRMPPKSGPVLIAHPEIAAVLGRHWRP